MFPHHSQVGIPPPAISNHLIVSNPHPPHRSLHLVSLSPPLEYDYCEVPRFEGQGSKRGQHIHLESTFVPACNLAFREYYIINITLIRQIMFNGDNSNAPAAQSRRRRHTGEFCPQNRRHIIKANAESWMPSRIRILTCVYPQRPRSLPAALNSVSVVQRPLAPLRTCLQEKEAVRTLLVLEFLERPESVNVVTVIRAASSRSDR